MLIGSHDTSLTLCHPLLRDEDGLGTLLAWAPAGLGMPVPALEMYLTTSSGLFHADLSF